MFLKFLSGKERVLPEFPVDKSNVWGKIELYRQKEEGEDLILSGCRNREGEFSGGSNNCL